MFTTSQIIVLALSLLGVRIAASGQFTGFPIISLSFDTSLFENAFHLDAGNAGMNFLWNTGDTSQVLSVEVTGSIGCTGKGLHHKSGWPA